MKITAVFALVGAGAFGLLLLRGADLALNGVPNPFTPTQAIAQDAAPADEPAEPAAEGEAGVMPDSMAIGDAAPGSDETMAPAQTFTRTEQAVLESLAARRSELETRENELVMRERLLEAAEARLDERIAELSALEQRINAAAAASRAQKNESFRDLVTMYENMKPKDAARIFNTLDSSVLVPVAGQIKPRTMAEILASMDPAAAQRLTVALARQSASEEDPTMMESTANDL